MKRFLFNICKLISIYLLLICYISAYAYAEIDTPDALRALYAQKIPDVAADIYAAEPVTDGTLQPGQLTDAALARALGEVNFLRTLAGLPEVSLRDDLNELCQYGAVLLANSEEVAHDLPQPDGMSDDFYLLADRALRESNLARLNWMENDILHQAIRGFICDEGTRNETLLGHRRWLLYPRMAYTGFGLANDAEGRSCLLMYVMDDSLADFDYDRIAWPSSGCFPAEYLSTDTVWSISPNPTHYSLTGEQILVTLREANSGAEFHFNLTQEQGDGLCCLSGGRYGDGPALLFRPNLSLYPAVKNGYEQNQVWQVTVSGLCDADGNALADMTYEVRIASLSPIAPVMVEFEEEYLSLVVGDTCAVSARVIPAWADDTDLSWQIADEEIASVDAQGQLTALAPGKTTLTATASNGISESIPITVAPSNS